MFLFLLVLFSLAVSLQAEERPITIGCRPQLMVDDRLIAEQTGLARLPVTVTKANDGRPLPIEGRLYGTVLHDGEKFRFWCRNLTEGYHYSESLDGFHFERRGDVTGIPFAGDYTLAVEFDRPSADGLAWTPLNEGRPVTYRAADTYNQILWDPTADHYRLLTRTDFGGAGGADELRGHRTMTNKDPWRNPTNWKTVGEWNLDKTGKRRQIYAATHWIHERYHFALLSVYEWPGDLSEGPADLHQRHEKDVMNAYLVTSHDGVHWNMDPVESELPFIPRGPSGSFDKDLLLPSSSIVTWNNRHWLYYSGADERHGTPEVTFPRTIKIGLATFPLNRFYALAPMAASGSFTTKPFLYESATFTVNLDASAGSIDLELLDESGRPLGSPGQPRHARIQDVDATHHPIRWSTSDISPGTPVRLRATVHNARLYSFQFTDLAEK